MLPSTRLAVYFGLGAVLWVAAALVPGFLMAAVLYDLVLVFVAGLDLLLSPKPRTFEIERRVDDKMNLGVPNTVTLHARWRASEGGGRLPVRLVLRDEPPLTWPVGGTGTEAMAPATASADEVVVPPVARVTVELAPQGEAAAVYHVTPTRRGDFIFGGLSARYATYLGLWYRQLRQPGEQRVRVYPDTTEVRRYELRLRQGRLQDIGLHLMRLRGRGTEFESLREYTSDDEYKGINWKASARQGKLISTNYEIERDQTIVIALDCGRMMTALAVMRERGSVGGWGDGSVGGWGDGSVGGDSAGQVPALGIPHSQPSTLLYPHTPATVALSKLDCAINATVLLAHVAVSMGDAVGLLLFADTVIGFVPPRKGTKQTGAIIEALYAAQPALVEPDYGAAFEYLLARKIRRSLVVTFTDLIDPMASRELLTAAGTLRRRHNALCVTINNHDVIDLAAMMPQNTGELYQKAMAQRMLGQRHNALEELRRRGVGILDVAAEELTVATVNRYLDLKSRAAL